MKLKNKLMSVGISLTVVPLLVLAVNVYMQNKKSIHVAEEESLKLAYTDLNHITEGVYKMVVSQQELLEKQVNAAVNVMNDHLTRGGGVTLSEKNTTWTSKNQFSGAEVKIDLPRFYIGETWLRQNFGFEKKTPLVDEVGGLLDVAATIFQRMNPAGDMIRVATNIKTKQGQRAIGTFIPAVEPEGKTNAVIESILKGRSFLGRAFVVDSWYLTAYEPIIDSSGQVIGMIFCGVKEESAASVRRQVMSTKVGETGYVYVLDSKGHYVISQDGKRDGELIWEAKDANGNYFIQDIITTAQKLSPGEIGHAEYFWLNPGDPAPRRKIVRLAYFAPWDWVIGTGSYEDEFLASQQAITAVAEHSQKIIAGVIILSLVVSLAIWVFFGKKVGKIFGTLTSEAERLTKGAVDGQLAIRGKSELIEAEFRPIIDGFNATLDAVIAPFNMAAEYIDRISKGELPEKITDEYRGDFNEIKINLNNCIGNIKALVDDTGLLVESAVEGQLHTRADQTKHQGDYRKIIEGINETLDAVVGPIDESAKVLELVANQDLTAEVKGDYKGDLALMKNNINRMVADLRENMKRIAASSQGLGASSTELSQVSVQMAGNSEEASTQANVVSAASEQVSKNVTVVSSSAEEMLASIREIARSAGDAAKIAKNAVSVADATNTTVSKLGDSSAEIGNVVKLITAIAQQTNLLALNATIEAARAGEAGKGFAVVANEVKELAKETAKATEEISQKIDVIQTDTQSAVGAIGEITNVIQNINDISNVIATAVEEQTATTGEMVRNLGEAASGTGEIAKNITGVANAAKDSSQGASQVQVTAKEVSEMAVQLQDMVGRFQL